MFRQSVAKTLLQMLAAVQKRHTNREQIIQRNKHSVLRVFGLFGENRE